MVHLEDKKDWAQFEVITETGLRLGWVRSSSIDIEDDTQITLVVVSSSRGWLSEKFVGAYELASIKLVCIGSKRLIVAEGSEDKLKRLEVGLLERLGLIKPPWVQQQKGSYILPIVLRGEDGDTGFQPAIKPRRPNPNPMDDAAEIPFD